MNLRLSVSAAIAPFLLASFLVPGVAFAAISDADKATARELTIQGYDAIKAKDWATAADRYSRAEKLFQAGGEAVPPTISLGVARAHAALGKLVSAQEHYSKITHEVVPANASTQFLEAVSDAQKELPELAKRVPAVVINVKGSDSPKVTIDDVEVSAAALGVRRPADPGKHLIRATGVGVTPVEASVTLAEGKLETVSIELKPGPGGLPPPNAAGPVPVGGAPNVGGPAPAAEPVDTSAPLRRTIGFVGIGVGGAALVMGAITGGLALGKHGEIAQACPGGHCPVGSQGTNQSKIDSYNLMGTLSTAGFVAGGVLAATGIILVATAPNKAAAPTTGRIMPVVGPGYAGLFGKF